MQPARSKCAWWGPVWLLFAATCAVGYQDSRSLPIWPEDGRIPPELERQYVFLTPDRSALIFRVPADPEAGMEGPLKPVRVQFYTRFDLRVRVVEQSAGSSGLFRLVYQVCNGPDGVDAISAFGLIVPSGPEKVTLARVEQRQPPCWSGGAGSNDVGRQWALDPSLRGRMASWLRHSERPDCDPVRPGACLDGLEMISVYAPGFATAYAGAYKFPSIDWSWPREVMIQFDRADTHFLYRKYVLTIGPAFRPGTPYEQRVENFRKGISLLVEQGELRRDSPFVAELLRQLEAVESHGGGVRIEATPENEWESAILEAVKLSLGPAR